MIYRLVSVMINQKALMGLLVNYFTAIVVPEWCSIVHVISLHIQRLILTS